MCAHYIANPRESHFEHVKRIIKYVSGTTNLNINFPIGTTCEISGYTVADCACN